MYVILSISVELKWLSAEAHNPSAVKHPVSLPSHIVYYSVQR